MSEPARNRFALDLDDLERQLRGAAQPQKPGAASDPLMELTRLVGQDDPLKELFAGRPAEPARPAAPQPASWSGHRTEPSFQPTLVAAPPVPSAPPPADVRGALDEFEALLRRTEPVRAAPQPVAKAPVVPAHDYDEPEPLPARAQPYAMQQEGPHPYVPEQPRDLDEAPGQVHVPAHAYAPQPEQAYHQPAAEYDGQPEEAEHEHRDFRRTRSRKGMLTAAALVVVAVGGVAAAMVFRNGRPAGVNGQPPVIAADSGPSKVAPVNPGGAEIPNQNKQIYERSGDASADKTKVVSREEQPVDVQQAARSMAPRPTQSSNGAITPTDTAAAGLAPTEPGLIPIPAVPGLGEPRKVRTVAIRPDGTPAPTNAAVTNGAGQGIVTGSAPSSRPATTGSATPAPAAQTPATAPKTQERAAAPATPPAAQTPPANTRTAALAPQQQTQAAAPAAAAGPRTDPNGGFAVQLGAPGSEAEARATFAALQRKYPDQLSGQSPIIRKTELAGGKTVYRLRVGPYAREDASSMCTALQAAGGQCFIAKN
ncbi:MAG TPA: SPOR domain-containing protein [Bosea sp. (in: a-proteobacteria)]|nr:SPOR domain-containing protein [Bosea sp. (in: a-proteobacteria)]